jgi:hypothetical protein
VARTHQATRSRAGPPRTGHRRRRTVLAPQRRSQAIADRLADPRQAGEAFYHTFLYKTFQDQANHTPAQGALIRANFKAYITTNYDGGILEARRRLRPDIRDTGFTVWNQSYPVNRWASGDIFEDTPLG